MEMLDFWDRKPKRNRLLVSYNKVNVGVLITHLPECGPHMLAFDSNLQPFAACHLSHSQISYHTLIYLIRTD